MLYAQFTNADLVKVSHAMMGIMETFDNLTYRLNRGEKCAAIAAVFKAMVDGDLGEQTSLGEILGVPGTMASEAKRMHIPEYGAAVNYVQRELTSIR
jgi:hypothetical protein